MSSVPPPSSSSPGGGDRDHGLRNDEVHSRSVTKSPDSIPPSGDGRTPQTAQWALAMSRTSSKEFTYVAYHLGLGRWVRTVAYEARMYAGQGSAVLDGFTYRSIAESDWAQRIPAVNLLAGETFQRQVGEIEQAQDALDVPTSSSECLLYGFGFTLY
jgi:hypothetical protein